MVHTVSISTSKVLFSNFISSILIYVIFLNQSCYLVYSYFLYNISVVLVMKTLIFRTLGTMHKMYQDFHYLGWCIKISNPCDFPYP